MSKENGIDILLGNQRRGVIALAVPLGIALLIQQINSLVDSLWVAGLGSNAMAAVGLVSPIFAAIVGIGAGLGIGISAAISRSIGKNDKYRSDLLSAQGLLLTAAISIMLTAILLITAGPVLRFFGAGDTLPMCLEYAIPLYIGTIFIVLSGVMSGMLRGEGAAKRSMIIQSIGAVLNIVLDPIFIYTLNMGVSGAAWATVIALAVSAIVPFWWYLVKKDTFITIRKESLYRYDRSAGKDILAVGLPEMLELSIMNIFNVILNFFIIMVGGTDVVGIFNSMWKVIFLCVVPAQAIGGALVSICSAEYGMRKFDRIKDAFRYSTKISLICMAVVSIMLIALSEPLASLFTISDDMNYLHGEFRTMLIIGALFIPAFSLVYTGSSLMQSLRKAGQAMVNTLLRNIIITIAFAAVAILSSNTVTLWYLLLITEIIGGLMMYIHAKIVLNDVLRKEGVFEKRSQADECVETRVKGVKSLNNHRIRIP